MTEETIFLTALEKTTPAERAAFLDVACAGDPALRERVEALLRSHADPDSFLDRPALVRQAEGKAEPNRTTDLLAGAAQGAMLKRREAKSDIRAEVLALLAPGSDPGSLGRLDQFEILEVVGCGGMGIVFKARDTKLQRIVAIKILAPQVAANVTARKRFFREAQASAAVRNDHVVDIYAVSDEGAVPYLAMEFIDGVTLEQRIRRSGPLEVKEVLRIGMQAAEGLAAAHRQGLIHRDVKPANILLENGVQRVKITDFGLARAADDATLSQSGVIAGTPLYMSPEQARGETLDPRSDLFSLGSALYTLCTGRAAFAADNTLAVLKRVCEEAPRPIREINPDIPEWLAAVVDRLMAKDAGERFQTAAELAEVLSQHLVQLQQSRLTPTPPSKRQEAVPSAAAHAQPGGPAVQKRKRVAVALLMVGVVASLMTVAVRSWTKLPPTPGKAPESGTTVPAGPRVLTVSKRPEGGGRFRTIQEALNEVAPGMTIRVLDDAVYEERLLIDQREQYRGVILEATGKASLRKLSDKSDAILIRGVPGFTLRGFRFASPPDKHPFAQVGIAGCCPGVVLDRLDMMSGGRDCVDLIEEAAGTRDDPIVIRNCTMRGGTHGVIIEGRSKDNAELPLPSGHVVIRDNTMLRCAQGVVLIGAVHNVHEVGNRILDTKGRAIDLVDLVEGAGGLVVANNTMLGCESAVGIWDDDSKGNGFLKCKNIRVQNNLVFQTAFPADMVFSNHRRDEQAFKAISPCDLNRVLNNPEWRFSHNWREVDRQRGALVPERWIPFSPTDHRLEPTNAVLSQKPGDSNFLRPPKDSPLATGGAGVTDPLLPAYVGAVPPEGVEPWDWDKTWSALTH